MAKKFDWTNLNDRILLCTGLTAVLRRFAPQEAHLEELMDATVELTESERAALRQYFGTNKKVRDL